VRVFKFIRNTKRQPDRKAVEGKRGGELRKKEEKAIRNGGVEVA